MKTKPTIQAILLLTLVLVMSASAQGPRGRGGPEGGAQDGQGGQGQPPSADEISILLLDEYDLDGDLALSVVELDEAIAALPVEPTPLSEAIDWMDAYDTDGSGALTAAELAVGLEANKPQRGSGGPPRGNR